jgi:hypothetical protein
MVDFLYNLYNESQKTFLISIINKIGTFAYNDQRMLFNVEVFSYDDGIYSYYITLYDKKVCYIKFNNNGDTENFLNFYYSSVSTLIDLLEIEFKYHIRKLKIENMLKNE